MYGNTLLIINVSAWFFLLIKHYKKSKIFGIGSFILLEFVFCAFCSLVLYNDVNDDQYHVELAIIPLLLFFILLYITSYPLIREDNYSITKVQAPSNYLLKYISIIYIVCSLIDFPIQVKDLLDSLPLILSQGAGLDMYIAARDGYEGLGSGIDHLFTVIAGMFMHIGIFIAFYYLMLNDVTKRKYVILLFISYMPHLFNGISSGQRGGMIQQLLFFMGTYLLFRKFYSSKIKKRIDTAIITVIVIVSIPFVYLTISRFGDYEGQAKSSFFSYSGQQTLYFNQYAFDNNGIRYGDRVVPLIKYIAGCDNVPNNFMQRRYKYPKLYIDDGFFISYIGDFFLDFGPWNAIFLLLLLSYMFQRGTKIRNSKICFYQLFLLEILICIITIGIIKLWPYSEIVGNIRFLFDLFFVCLFKLDYDKQKANKIDKAIVIK
jgi:oligosaccharide repeat unit polymerase